MPLPLGRFFQVFLPVTLAAFCLLVSPRTAAADPADIVTLPINVTWTSVSCLADQEDQFACSGSGGTFAMAATFQFDPDTMAISGISDPEITPPFFVSVESSAQGPDIYTFSFDIHLFGAPPGGSLNISYYAGSWRVVPGSVSGDDSQDFVFVDFDDDGFGQEIGTLNWVATPEPTPEPSSFLLLGTGLLALWPLLRRQTLVPQS